MKTSLRAQAMLFVAIVPTCALPASAGLQTGAYVSQNDLVNQQFTQDGDLGTGFGSYRASLTGTAGTTAALDWYATNATFTGTCSGSSALDARSQGIAAFTFAASQAFHITYAMSQIVRTGNSVGWALVDSNTGDTVAGLSFDGTAASTAGGVSTQANDSFSTTIDAGSYLLVALAECTDTGGTFVYDATFTAAPAPGALAVLAVATALPSRRRRSR
jgi:hypothetical protein